jgi:hypothetical protein
MEFPKIDVTINVYAYPSMQEDVASLRDDIQSVLSKISTLSRKGSVMNAAVEKLVQEVSESRTVVDSAVVLIGGLKAALDEAIANNDMSALEALAADLDSQQAALAQAVQANTPAAPVDVPVNPAV